MSYQYELRHIRYFLAVADELHFRKAAERLFISQPGLSRQIKELEIGLGVRLFERTNRKVALTKAGLFFQVEMKKQMKNLDQIVNHAKLLNDGLLGDLKLGYVGSAMQEIIPQLLIAFRKKYPNVLFTLKEMDNSDQLSELLSHDIDLGFIRMDRVPRGLEAHPILTEPFCLVLPKGHRLEYDNFKDMSDLKGESFILFDPKYSPSYYEKVMQIFDDSGFVPNVTHNTIHSNSIYKLVEHGFGMSIVPRSLQQKHLKKIKFIELDKIPQRTILYAIWNSNYRNPVMRDFLKEILRTDAS